MLAHRGLLQSLNYAVLGLATIGLAVALRRLGARIVESALVALLGHGFLHALGLTIVMLAALGAMAAIAGSPNLFAVFLSVLLAWLMLVALRCLELSRAGSAAAS